MCVKTTCAHKQLSKSENNISPSNGNPSYALNFKTTHNKNNDINAINKFNTFADSFQANIYITLQGKI